MSVNETIRQHRSTPPILVVAVVLQATALSTAALRPAPSHTIQAPTIKWQYGGCYSSWCETGWYSSPAVADLDGDDATGTLEWRVKSGHDNGCAVYLPVVLQQNEARESGDPALTGDRADDATDQPPRPGSSTLVGATAEGSCAHCRLFLAITTTRDERCLLHRIGTTRNRGAGYRRHRTGKSTQPLRSTLSAAQNKTQIAIQSWRYGPVNCNHSVT